MTKKKESAKAVGDAEKKKAPVREPGAVEPLVLQISNAGAESTETRGLRRRSA